VAPHGAWHQVPFAALPFGGARLVDAFSVAMTPSLAALSPRVGTATGRPIVLAVADARTPTIVDEGRAVAATAADAVLLEGDAATSGALRVDAPPRFVHVASHGRFRADVPSMSGVALADGWLRAVDFHGLRLDGSLVVLSGCETGASRVDPGGEVQGLVRGVMSSGAAELVVSLWRVEDASATRLMSRFHELRATGPETGRALATAQREAAASGLDPWHWAGFTLWTRRVR
jgi:CHAT domain-containing protein